VTPTPSRLKTRPPRPLPVAPRRHHGVRFKSDGSSVLRQQEARYRFVRIRNGNPGWSKQFNSERRRHRRLLYLRESVLPQSATHSRPRLDRIHSSRASPIVRSSCERRPSLENIFERSNSFEHSFRTNAFCKPCYLWRNFGLKSRFVTIVHQLLRMLDSSS
jgi:hypothetical protein